VIAIPAAFTVPTGKAHWHLLQRARAVEASACVVAAAQVGEHADGRRTYGHSLVVDPWGEVVLDMGGEAPGSASPRSIRGGSPSPRQLPSLANRRPSLHRTRNDRIRPSCDTATGSRAGSARPTTMPASAPRARQLPAVRFGAVEKAPMAPAVPRKGNAAAARRRRPSSRWRAGRCRPKSPRRSASSPRHSARVWVCEMGRRVRSA
jgi:hypothetical protein